MSLPLPVKVQELRNSLHAKAKGSASYRFHALYDKVYRTDVLAHAYRPDRRALDAVSRVVQRLQTGHRQVVDADLSGYFDSIPHAEPLKSLARRISDGAMLHLLKLWLCMAVEEVDERGRTREVLLREPDAANPHVRFDERDVETEYGGASEAPADERAGK